MEKKGNSSSDMIELLKYLRGRVRDISGESVEDVLRNFFGLITWNSSANDTHSATA